MGRVLFSISVSVDGFFEGPDRDLSWHRVDEELHQHFNDESRRVRAFLEGRVTHELMAAYWPTADTDPSSAPVEKEFAGIWRDMPKVVYSTTISEAGWNGTVSREVDPVAVRRLLDQGDLAVGGPLLAQTFFRLGLVDEVRLYVHPVVVGAGRRPFADDLSLDLRLDETRAFGNGVTLLRYAVRR
ncbi:MAG: dihydrofolate reductase family protein [Candidatus Nanopelagicales bacterium]